eukprot:354689-Hanusia_phi.AAC.1
MLVQELQRRQDLLQDQRRHVLCWGSVSSDRLAQVDAVPVLQHQGDVEVHQEGVAEPDRAMFLHVDEAGEGGGEHFPALALGHQEAADRVAPLLRVHRSPHLIPLRLLGHLAYQPQVSEAHLPWQPAQMIRLRCAHKPMRRDGEAGSPKDGR